MTDQDAFNELSAYTLGRGDSAFIHQHVVDAFAAQTAKAGDKPIRLTFALVGLYLHVEKGCTGRFVQRVHMQMAQRKRTWPAWTLPTERGALTAIDVMRAAPGPERDRAIDAWCASVWETFHANREGVAALLAEYGIDGPSTA
jgi:hypothetical protein